MLLQARFFFNNIIVPSHFILLSDSFDSHGTKKQHDQKIYISFIGRLLLFSIDYQYMSYIHIDDNHVMIDFSNVSHIVYTQERVLHFMREKVTPRETISITIYKKFLCIDYDL